MTKPGTAQPDTKRRRASTGRMMDEIMELARQLPLTRQVLADQLETATPAQMEFIHTWMLAELDSRERSKRARLLKQAGFPQSKEPGRLRPGRPCGSPSTTGVRPSNPSTSSNTRRTWSCSGHPAQARPTSPSRWGARPAGGASRSGSSPPPNSSCDCCAPTRRSGSTRSSPRSAKPGSSSSTSSATCPSTRRAAACSSRS